MIKPSQLRQLSKSIKGKKDTEERGYFAVIGKKDGTVSTGIPGIIWVTVIATGQEIQVINRRYVPNRRGIVVFVGSDKQSANKIEVLYMLNTDGSTNGGIPTVISTVPPHNHSWPGENTTYVYGEQIIELLAKPIAGTLTIQIYPGMIRNSTGDGLVYIASQVVDVSGDVPASDALWITLQANDDGSVDYVVGSVNVARTSLDEGDIPEATTGKGIWAVILEAGRNELFQNAVINDFLDLRFADREVLALENPTGLPGQYLGGDGYYHDLPTVDGWVSYSAVTPTRASADDPTYVLTFASVDITDKISVGMRLKWTQNSTVRYGIVTAIAFSTNTTLTLYGGTDYDVDDTGTYAISDFYYSPVKVPFGFPLDDSKWTISISDSNRCQKTTPASGTWYGDTGLSSTGPSISVPIGLWKGYYKGLFDTFDTTVTDYNVWSTLSTSASTESDTDNTALIILTTPSGSYKTWNTAVVPVRISVASKTTYYLNIKTTTSTSDNIDIRGDVTPTIIKLVCAYL